MQNNARNESVDHFLEKWKLTKLQLIKVILIARERTLRRRERMPRPEQREVRQHSPLIGMRPPAGALVYVTSQVGSREIQVPTLIEQQRGRVDQQRSRCRVDAKRNFIQWKSGFEMPFFVYFFSRKRTTDSFSPFFLHYHSSWKKFHGRPPSRKAL